MALESFMRSSSQQLVVDGLLVAAPSGSQWLNSAAASSSSSSSSSSFSCNYTAQVWNPLLSASSLRRVKRSWSCHLFLGSKLSSRLWSSSRRGEVVKDFLRYAGSTRASAMSRAADHRVQEEENLVARSGGNEEEEEEEPIQREDQEQNQLVAWVKLMTTAVAESVVEAGKTWQKPVMVGMMMGLLMTQNLAMAIAAGGGRVGGKVGGGGSGFSAPRSSNSRSYSAPSSGYTIPYSAPSPGFSYSVPYAVPSPWACVWRRLVCWPCV